MSPKPGNLIRNIGDPVIHQAGDDEALAILQFEFRIGFAGADAREWWFRRR